MARRQQQNVAASILGNEMEPIFDISNINNLAFIPWFFSGTVPKISATPDATFSGANLHVNRLRARTERTQEVRAARSRPRAGR
jgi:hypothetical protein